MPDATSLLAPLSALPQIGLGAYETIQGSKGLKNLQGQPMSNYSLSPELQDYYAQTSLNRNVGYSPEETAAFKSSIGEQQNTAFKQGIEQGGGSLSQALANGLGSQNLMANNQFAAQGAQLKRQHMSDFGGAASAMQGQENIVSQQNIARRNKLEDLYGGALMSGLTNLTSGLSSGIGLAAKSAAPLGGGSSSSGGGLNGGIAPLQGSLVQGGLSNADYAAGATDLLGPATLAAGL